MSEEDKDLDSIELPDGKIIADDGEMPVDLDDDLSLGETEIADEDSLFGGSIEADDY